MNKLYEDAMHPRPTKETISELLTNPDRHALVLIYDQLIGETLTENLTFHPEPSIEGFAINLGRVPYRGRIPVNSFIEDPKNRRYFEIREKINNNLISRIKRQFNLFENKDFTITSINGSCCFYEDFDKFNDMYLYHGTIDDMIAEVKLNLKYNSK